MAAKSESVCTTHKPKRPAGSAAEPAGETRATRQRKTALKPDRVAKPKGRSKPLTKRGLDFAAMQQALDFELQKLPLDRLQPGELDRVSNDTDQAKEEFDGLVENIRHLGILEPLVVVAEPEGYRILAGKRRFLAAQKLELKEVPCHVVTSTLQGKAHERLITLSENAQRKDNTPYEQALLFEKVREETNLTKEQIATTYGVSKSVVSEYLQLLDPELRSWLGEEKYGKLMRGDYPAKTAIRGFKAGKGAGGGGAGSGPPDRSKRPDPMKTYTDETAGITFRVRGIDKALGSGLTAAHLIGALDRWIAAIKATAAE